MAQMPGEARGYQFAPPQAAGTPAAMVDNFTQIEDLQTLIAMQQRNPSIPLLAHIDEVRKKLQAKQAVANNLAIRQAQQQGPQTLNDQILAGAEQVAGMSPVRRMAAGGIVALTDGGVSSTITDAQIRDAVRQVGVLRYIDALLGSRPNFNPRVGTQTQRAAAAEWDRKAEEISQRFERLRGQPVPAAAATAPAAASTPAAAASTPAAAPYPESLAVREGRRAAAAGAAAGTGTGTGTGTTSTIRNRGVDTTVEKPRQGPPPAAEAPAAPDAVTQALNALVDASTTPTEVPQALREQRTKVAGIQELMTKQAMDEATRVRNELDRELARREGRLNKPFLEGDMLPLLASFLSAKKGEFFPSLARGLAAVSTEEEKGRKELAQYRATEGERVRQLNNTYRQLQLEQAKYEMAWSEGDLKTARESSEKIAKLRYDAAVKTEELKNDRMRTQAEITRANKPTDFELFLRNPERFRDYMGARTGPRDEAALTAANARLTTALNNDPILALLRERAKNEMLTDAQRDTIIQAMDARIRQLKIENAPESAALGQATGAAGTAAGTGTPAPSDAYNRAVGILKQGPQ